jgi:hypothetical protein
LEAAAFRRSRKSYRGTIIHQPFRHEHAAAIVLRDWSAEQGFDDVFVEIDPDRGVVPRERWQEALKAAAKSRAGHCAPIHRPLVRPVISILGAPDGRDASLVTSTR